MLFSWLKDDSVLLGRNVCISVIRLLCCQQNCSCNDLLRVCGGSVHIRYVSWERDPSFNQIYPPPPPPKKYLNLNSFFISLGQWKRFFKKTTLLFGNFYWRISLRGGNIYFYPPDNIPISPAAPHPKVNSH